MEKLCFTSTNSDWFDYSDAVSYCPAQLRTQIIGLAVDLWRKNCYFKHINLYKNENTHL